MFVILSGTSSLRSKPLVQSKDPYNRQSACVEIFTKAEPAVVAQFGFLHCGVILNVAVFQAK